MVTEIILSGINTPHVAVNVTPVKTMKFRYNSDQPSIDAHVFETGPESYLNNKTLVKEHGIGNPYLDVEGRDKHLPLTLPSDATCFAVPQVEHFGKELRANKD